MRKPCENDRFEYLIVTKMGVSLLGTRIAMVYDWIYVVRCSFIRCAFLNQLVIGGGGGTMASTGKSTKHGAKSAWNMSIKWWVVHVCC